MFKYKWDIDEVLEIGPDKRWVLTKHLMTPWPLGKVSDDGSCSKRFLLSVQFPVQNANCVLVLEKTLPLIPSASWEQCLAQHLDSRVRISKLLSWALQVSGTVLALASRKLRLCSCLCVTFQTFFHLNSELRLSDGGHIIPGASWLLY